MVRHDAERGIMGEGEIGLWLRDGFMLREVNGRLAGGKVVG